MAWDKCFRILVGGEGEGLGMEDPTRDGSRKCFGILIGSLIRYPHT